MGQQGRGYPGQSEDVDTEQLQGLLSPCEPRLHLHHRTGFSHLGAGGDQRVEGLIKPAARSHHLQIRFTSDGAQAAAELKERRLMDRLYPHAQRHAEYHGGK